MLHESPTILITGTIAFIGAVSITILSVLFIFFSSFLIKFSTSKNVLYCQNNTDILKYCQSKFSQNYPNPFNPSTVIRYSVPKTGFVNIAVYNLLGQEVKVLVNEEKHIGEYEVRFDGSNLPSGTYLYKIQSNGFVATKKMTLVK